MHKSVEKCILPVLLSKLTAQHRKYINALFYISPYNRLSRLRANQGYCYCIQNVTTQGYVMTTDYQIEIESIAEGVANTAMQKANNNLFMAGAYSTAIIHKFISDHNWLYAYEFDDGTIGRIDYYAMFSDIKSLVPEYLRTSETSLQF